MQTDPKWFQFTLGGLIKSVIACGVLIGAMRINILVGAFLGFVFVTSICARLLRWSVEWSAAAAGCMFGIVFAMIVLGMEPPSYELLSLSTVFFALGGAGAGAFVGLVIYAINELL